MEKGVLKIQQPFGPQEETNRPNLIPLDGVDRAHFVASSTIGAGRLIDNMQLPFFTDGVDRANIRTGSTVDAIVGNIVRSHTTTSLV
jgi:hypothetical protein